MKTKLTTKKQIIEEFRKKSTSLDVNNTLFKINLFNRAIEEYPESEYELSASKIEAFLEDALDTIEAQTRQATIEDILTSLPRKFWEDEDHAVGGYISKKDLKELFQSLSPHSKEDSVFVKTSWMKNADGTIDIDQKIVEEDNG